MMRFFPQFHRIGYLMLFCVNRIKNEYKCKSTIYDVLEIKIQRIVLIIYLHFGMFIYEMRLMNLVLIIK